MTHNLNKLKQDRENYRQNAFRMMLEIGVIIALPVVVAFFVGNYLDSRLGTDETYLLIALGVALVTSWTIIIRKYRKFNQHIQKIDQAIKQTDESSPDND